MLEQTLAIIRNTFFESIRQPIMLVILVVASLALILANPLSAFTMEDDQRMLIHMGLATVFLCGALLASFIATSVLTREIENKTALTVVAKPVARPLFVLGKYLGVAAAIVVGVLYMSFVFLLVEVHSVLQTVRDPIHLPVIVFGLGAVVLGLATGIWCNYFYGKVFSSTAIIVTTPLAGVAYLLSLMFRHDFSPQPIATSFRPDLWMGLGCLLIAILVLTAIAIAASTRLGQVMTLCVTLGVFMLGMLSDWIFGRPIKALESLWLSRAVSADLFEMVPATQVVDPGPAGAATAGQLVEQATVPLTQMAQGAERLEYIACWVGYAIVPNFQVLFLSDAVTQGHAIPIPYVVNTALYGALYIVAALCAATILFQRREVG